MSGPGLCIWLIMLTIPQQLQADWTSGRKAVSENVIPLPAPVTDAGMPLAEALRLRRSVRDYGRGALALAEIAQLLWATQGITDPEGLRTAPSAGALYPLEIYLVAGDVAELAAGVYHYLPERHELTRVLTDDPRSALAAAALGQSWVRQNAAVLAACAVYARTESKYGRRAKRYVHMEAGHAAQNLFLQATSLNLNTVVVGAFDDAAVRKVLRLPKNCEPLWLMPVGR